MSYDSMNLARNLLNDLCSHLQRVSERDPEQEVWENAQGVIDAVIQRVRDELGPDPIVQAVRDLISPEAAISGESVRAVDLLTALKPLQTLLNMRVSRMARGE